jgi:methylase of polypeptide subunit release factors
MALLNEMEVSETVLSEAVLTRILQFAKTEHYRFITVTPSTHEHALRKRPDPSIELRDIFGWNTYFLFDAIPPALQQLFADGNCLDGLHQYKKSSVRIASIDTDLFVHSAYPTLNQDAVFLGPDTYRFVRFIKQVLQQLGISQQPHYRIVDIGCGSGAGGIMAARALAKTLATDAIELVMNDINPTALHYTKVNAAVAGIPVSLAPGDAFKVLTGNFDLIICNPPFLCDASERTYRHGGNNLGRDLSLRLTREALGRLNPGGHLILYTGVVITGDRDPFLAEITPDLDKSGYEWRYEEIDPDIFGEELEESIYQDAERIAAVGLVVKRRDR